MKRIVVLGANGQLGQTLKSLVNKEQVSYDFYSREDLDITDKDSLEDSLEKESYNFCINCAAYTNVEQAEKDVDKAFLINAQGVKNVAEVCKSKKIKLIHISTDYVFDGKKRKPYTTTDHPNPINQYGKSKLRGELYIKDVIKEYYIIRTSWLYSRYNKNFLKTIIKKTKENSSLNITTEEQGTPTSCIDLCKFIIYLINSDSIPFGTYNFSARGQTTWYGFAKEIVLHFNPNRLSNLNPINSFKTVANRPKYSVLDISETENVYMNLNTWRKSVKTLVDELR